MIFRIGCGLAGFLLGLLIVLTVIEPLARAVEQDAAFTPASAQ